jgi:hypothetical protein
MLAGKQQTCRQASMVKGRLADRYTDRQAGRHEDRQASMETERLADMHADRQADRQETHRRPWGPEIHKLGRGGNMWVSQTCWQAGSRHADRQASMQTDRQAGRYACRQTGRLAGKLWQAGRQTQKTNKPGGPINIQA